MPTTPDQPAPAPAPPANPKTTLMGLLAAVGVALLAAGDYFDVQALKAVGGALAALGAGAVGFFAQDKPRA